MTNGSILVNTCAIERCEKYIFAKGICSLHYQRMRAYGDPHIVKIRPHFTKRKAKISVRHHCIAIDCTEWNYVKGMCKKHYARYKVHGEINNVSRIVHEGRNKHPLYKLYHGMLDRCRNVNHTHYAYYGGRGITVCERWRGLRGFDHFLEDMGERPEGLTLDRIDNNKGYSPDNCAWATRSRQQYNQRKPRTNTSGHKGVSMHKKTGRWAAYITLDGKRKHLGYYGTIDEAVNARDKAEKLLHLTTK